MAKAEKIVNGKNGLVCAFCGKVKEEVSFVIGACSKKPDWCMIYGTGKMACPDCYEKGSKEAEVLGEKHVAAYNAACKKSMFLTPKEMESSKKTVIYTAKQTYDLNGRTWRGDECLTPDTIPAGADFDE